MMMKKVIEAIRHSHPQTYGQQADNLRKLLKTPRALANPELTNILRLLLENPADMAPLPQAPRPTCLFSVLRPPPPTNANDNPLTTDCAHRLRALPSKR